VQDLYLTFCIVSFLIFLLGAIFVRIQEWPISESLIAMVAGIICGPFLLSLINMQDWGEPPKIMRITSELTIAMALMATGLRLPANYFLKHKKSQSIIVIGNMLLMWTLSTSIFWLTFPEDILIAALAGAIITPTDPVVASSITSGKFAKKHLSKKIRNTLSFESGSNDGMAFPIVMLPLIFIIAKPHPWEEWLLKSFLWETIGGIFFGLIVGVLAGRIVKAAADKNHLMTEKSLLASSLALAFFIIGAFSLIKVNAIIAVFIAGLAFNGNISKNDELKDEKIQEMMERLFVIPVFFFFGLVIPFERWLNEGWALVLLVVGILLLRRLPALFMLKTFLKGYTKTDFIVLGWFGPIGVTSIFYVFHAHEKFQYEFLWTATSAVIFGSTVVHGMTSSLVSQWFRRKTEEGSAA
jgi:NhaP-type Na+/H+ or K+/H+ antiporter